MMKKFFLGLIISIFPMNAFAFQDCDLTLKKNEAYMLFMDERPVQLVIMKPEIAKVNTAADLYNQNFQVVIRALKKGETELRIVTSVNKQYTVKITVDEDPVISQEVFEIDPPPGM